VFNATRACELLVGLPAVNVLEVLGPLVGRLEITVESILDEPRCPNGHPMNRAVTEPGALQSESGFGTAAR
jgi:hypothetical protein